MRDIIEDGIEIIETFGTQTVGLAGWVIELCSHLFDREEGPHAFHDIVIDGDIRPLAAITEAFIHRQNNSFFFRQTPFEILVDLLCSFLAAFSVQTHLDGRPSIL